MESSIPIRKTRQLWSGRNSDPYARYFITICLKDRSQTLLTPTVPSKLFDQLESQHGDGDFYLHCGVVMADHLHLIFKLGNRLSFGQTIAKFKAKTKSLASWQRDFYEHKIQSDESEEDYAFYVFMNPYVDGLSGMNKRWPWWKRWRSIPYEFEEMLGEGSAVPTSWIKRERELDIGA